MGSFQISKPCNPLCPNASLTAQGAAFVARLAGDRMRGRMDGLWGGGHLRIDDAAIRF